VLCQKTIHPQVRLKLLRSHVLALERLSIRHVAAVRELTGCPVLSDVHAPPTAYAVGHLTGIEEVTIAGKRFIHLSNMGRPCHTLLLVADAREALEAAEAAARRALRMLGPLLTTTPTALAGAGAFECCLVRHLRQKADTLAAEFPHPPLRAQIALALKSFAKGMMLPVRALVASGAAADIPEAIDRLEAANEGAGLSGKCTGWDPKVGDVMRVSGPNGPPAVADSAVSKAAAIRSAVETALLLLRLDGPLLGVD